MCVNNNQPRQNIQITLTEHTYHKKAPVKSSYLAELKKLGLAMKLKMSAEIPTQKFKKNWYSKAVKTTNSLYLVILGWIMDSNLQQIRNAYSDK